MREQMRERDERIGFLLHQPINTFRSSTNQRPPLLSQSTSAYFNVTQL